MKEGERVRKGDGGKMYIGVDKRERERDGEIIVYMDVAVCCYRADENQ